MFEFWSLVLSRSRRCSTLAVPLLLFGLVAMSGTQPAHAQVTALPAWNQQPATPAPSPVENSMMAYDPQTGNVVLFGGWDSTTSTFSDQTWTWNGTTWTQLSPAMSPPAEAFGQMVYDPQTGNVVLFGGENSSYNFLNTTWTWNGTTWTQLSPATSPPARQDSGMMAYDPQTGNIVLFGGYGAAGSLGDTWTWNGTTWTQQSPTTSPSGRAGAMLAYDAQAGQMLLFGGLDSTGYLNDTWTWNGTTWTQESPATSPAARMSSTMNYDPQLGQLVLFGGAGNNIYNDTWTWNGTTWTQLQPATSPSARYNSTMSYDAKIGQLVLFGGVDAGYNSLNDTWTLPFGAVNLGPVAVGSTKTQDLYFTIGANSATTVTAIKVLMKGASGLDFTNGSGSTCTATTYSSSTNCSVNVTFTPRFAALRRGAVVFLDGSTVLSTEYIYGTGTGPEVAFNSPITLNTLGGGISRVNGVAVDGAGNVYVADADTTAVYEIPPGCTSSSCVNTLGGGFSSPSSLAVDGAGSVYVADSANNAIKEIPQGCTSSSCVETLGGFISSPAGVAVDGAGNVYATGYFGNAVYEIPPGCTSSSCMKMLGGGFSSPYSVAVDGAGNVYVSNEGSNAVDEVPPGCTSSSCVETVGGGFSSPHGVAVDGAGNVYVANSSAGVVDEMPPSCTSSSCVNTLDGGFGFPIDVAVNGVGNVYIADANSNAVTEIARATPPSLNFQSTQEDVESSDSPQTVTVQNIGNAALTFPIPGTGTNPSVSSSFTLDSATTTCPQLDTSSSSGTLAVGTSCVYGIDFIPNAIGTISGSTVLTDDSLNAASPNYATQSISLSGESIAAVTQLGFVTPPPSTGTAGGNAGTVTVAEENSSGTTVTSASDPITLTVTGPNGYSRSYTQTASSGVASFNLSSVTLTTSGSYTYTAASGSYTTSIPPETIDPGPASTIAVVSASGQSGPIGTVLPNPVVIKVTDSYGNGVPGATVVFSGKGLSFTPSTTTTNSNGQASTTVTPTQSGTQPGTVTSGSYSTTFSETGTQLMPTVQVQPTSVVYGTATTTLTAIVAYSGTMAPTGAVTFTVNGGTSVTGICTGTSSPLTCVAAYPTANLSVSGGPYTVTANLASDTDYKAAMGTNTTALTITAAAPIIQWPTPAQITYGTALSGTQLDATASSNGSPVAGTFTYTPAAGTILGAGAHTLQAAFMPKDTTDYTTPAAVSTPLTVKKAASTVLVTSSTKNANLNASLSFTAIVTSATTGTPTGSVEFMDGTTVLGSSPLNSTGTATYTLSKLTAGLHQIAAVYSGDGNFLGSTSAPLAQIVTAPNFSLMNNMNSLSLNAGQKGEVTISMIPVGGFTGTVQLSCSGLPIESHCTFSPTSLTANGSNTTGTSTMTISTMGSNSGTVAMIKPGKPDGTLLAGIFWLPGLLFGLFLMWQRRKLTAKYRVLVLMLLVATTLSGMVGCGFAPPYTGPGTKMVTVTATNGTISRTTTIELTVKQ